MATIYMNLSLPVVTQTVGPEWAGMLNAALETIDAHDHSNGKGTKVTPAGLNINANLEFNSNNAIELRSARFDNQASELSDLNDIRCLYVSGGNLYYNNNDGTSVQITSGAGLNAASIGGIGGDYGTSTASVSYSNAAKKYSFLQSSGVTAFMDCGAVTIRENVSSANGVTLKSPNSLGASYDFTFPTALPASGQTKFVTLDSSGQLAAQYDVDDSTIQVSSNTIQVKDGGITTVKINDLAVTTSKINNGAVTRSKQEAVGHQISSSSGVFTTTSSTYVDVTNLSVSITTSGRPVMIMFIGVDGFTSEVSVTRASESASAFFNLVRNSTNVGGHYNLFTIANGATNTSIAIPTACLNKMDFPPAGTYTYKLQVRSLASALVAVSNVRMVVYEL